MARLLLGILIGILLVPLALYAWLQFGSLPVAVADKPLPQERRITHTALDARIRREMVKTPPIQPDEATYVGGAHIYADQCAVCHGYHGKPSNIGPHEYPEAPPLWEKHQDGSVVGVSDDPPGETYWKVANGIRLTGMPAYKDMLSEPQIWQVSLLLANADKPLPPAAIAILNGETNPIPPSLMLPQQHK